MLDRDFVISPNQRIPDGMVIAILPHGAKKMFDAYSAEIILELLPDGTLLECSPAMFTRLSAAEDTQQLH